MSPGKPTYLHSEIPELSSGFVERGIIDVGAGSGDATRALEVALGAMKIARRLGVLGSENPSGEAIPYGPTDKLLFTAPLTSALVSRRFAYLRGWKEFGSCIKGFNSLGLMAEQVVRESERFKRMPLRELNELKRGYLKSRKDSSGAAVFAEKALDAWTESDLLEVSGFDLAIWSCFAARTIVCSTSSNMGVSTHQALRLMQKTEVHFQGQGFTLLNRDEGRLVIWCPDERADFMNEEKTELLRALETDEPKITRLRTYINRQQRDPGALRDALRDGGYFFPTNPQSKEEVQNLLYVALSDLAKEKNTSAERLIRDDAHTRATLRTIGCEVENSRVIVREGIEGGISGLMLPYIIMLDEYLDMDLGSAASVWNQASIGAALAAAVLADRIFRRPEILPDNLRGEINSTFPHLSKFLDSKRLGANLATRIHGVFDVANVQSLAQLLGVVVEKHLSGRGTAYVGLGSSSYSNGNRCFEILRESLESDGAFRGKTAFHPATHTLNPFAQAVIFGEDLFRILKQAGAGAEGSAIQECLARVRKPEPAGAAGLAGYLLTRLDQQTLSMVELAHLLRLLGFSKTSFLEFAGYPPTGAGSGAFVQLASEEGPTMGKFAAQMLVLLDWGLKDLARISAREKARSRLNYWESPLDDLEFEYRQGTTCMYLTGDNTRQPPESLVRTLAANCRRNLEAIAQFLDETAPEDPHRQKASLSASAFLALYKVSKGVSSLGTRFEAMGKRLAQKSLSQDEEREATTKPD